MKITLAFLLTAFLSLVAAGQAETAEKDFAANIKKYEVEKYTMGEDASSGYDYLIYKLGPAIVKIRTVWSSSANPKWWVEDHYFNDGVPVLGVKLTLTKKQFKAVTKGSLISLPVTEKFYFKDSKLVKWIENGKSVALSDPRWSETEKNAFASARDTLEFYPTLKDL